MSPPRAIAPAQDLESQMIPPTPPPQRALTRLETPFEQDGWRPSGIGLERVPLLKKPMAILVRRREQVLYLVVGAWNTLFGYLVWALLQYLLHDYIYYLFILVIAWFPSVLNAYFGYRWFVFRSKGSMWRELPRFSLVYVFTLCIGLIGLPILLHVLPFSAYVVSGGVPCRRW